MIRTGVAVEEDVGAADMRVRRRRDQQDREDQEGALHRRTLRIAPPSTSPSAALIVASPTAHASPLASACSGTNSYRGRYQSGWMKYAKYSVPHTPLRAAGDCRNVANGHSTAISVPTKIAPKIG